MWLLCLIDKIIHADATTTNSELVFLSWFLEN